jgi:hypothetical protein
MIAPSTEQEVDGRRHVGPYDVNAIVSYNIRELRLRRNWMQHRVAERLAVFTGHQLPQASISAMERGFDGPRRRRFDAHELYLLSLVFEARSSTSFYRPSLPAVTCWSATVGRRQTFTERSWAVTISSTTSTNVSNRWRIPPVQPTLSTRVGPFGPGADTVSKRSPNVTATNSITSRAPLPFTSTQSGISVPPGPTTVSTAKRGDAYFIGPELGGHEQLANSHPDLSARRGMLHGQECTGRTVDTAIDVSRSTDSRRAD